MDPDDYELRPLDLSDTDLAFDLHQLRQTAYGQEAALLGLSAERFPPLQVGPRDLMASNELHLGAFQGRRLVGAIAWGADEEDPAAQHISALVVAPEAQRRGVATRLLHALVMLNGRGPLAVHTAQLNAPALALYEAYGFQAQRRWLSNEGLRLLRLRWRAGAG
jgi:ribosomal protein S18 acetylase RimI-like enzyme